jgi:rhodanese-related sulfurtransferase
MKTTTLLVLAAVFALLLLVKRSGLISVKEAQRHLRHGALVIDVRTAVEFASGHLPKAINVPFGEIEISLPYHVRDRSQVLLLHCHSGMRSRLARKKTIELGYVHSYNLGSYKRAEKVVKGQ